MSAFKSTFLKSNLFLYVNTLSTQSCSTFTSPVTDREHATPRSNLFYSWAILSVGEFLLMMSCNLLDYNFHQLAGPSSDSLELQRVSLIFPMWQPFKYLKKQRLPFSRVHSIHSLNRCPNTWGLSPSHSLGPSFWTWLRINPWDPLLKTSNMHIGMKCKITFFNFIEH